MAVWDAFITDRDREVYAHAGFGTKLGFGKRPAVIVIDVNYDFVGEEPAPILEAIKTRHRSCGEEGWAAVHAIAELLDSSRSRSLPIFYTTAPEPREDALGRGMWRNSRQAELSQTSGTSGVSGDTIVAEIAPQPRDVVLRKPKPSAFFGTSLLSLLLELGVDTVILTGTTTSGCVRATAIEGFSYNFHVSVVEECTFDRGQASHALNLFDMDSKYADVVSLEETRKYIAELPDGLFAERLARAK